MEMEDVLRDILENRVAEIHTGMPATVVAFHDGERPTVDVQPVVRRPIPDLDGETQFETPPVIPSVPILYPQASGVSIVWRLAPGDSVWLAIPEQDTTEWNQTGEVSNPGDERRHHLSGAVAYPGGGHRGQAIPGGVPNGQLTVTAPLIVLGDHTATDFVALASKVDEMFERLRSAIEHAVPGASDGGSALRTSLLGLWAMESVAATKVVAK